MERRLEDILTRPEKAVLMEEGVKAGVDSDAGWEYEYDLNDIEDYYFTLDLTSLRATPPSGPQANNNNKRSGQRLANQKSRTSSHGVLHDEPVASHHSSNTGGSAGELQVLGLHSGNPFVRFNGEHYSCYWSSDLGTQFYISQPGAVERPLRKGHVLDVISTSQVRLLGKPVKLREHKQRNESNGSQQESLTATSAMVVDDQSQNDNAPPPAFSDASMLRRDQGLQIPKDRIKDAATQAQASFLERWSAIKVEKGERDSVPVNPVRHYQLPANMAETRTRTESGQAQGRRTGECDTSKSIPKRQRVDVATINVPDGPRSFRPLLPAPALNYPTKPSAIKQPYADFGPSQSQMAAVMGTVQYDVPSWDQPQPLLSDDMRAQPGLSIMSFVGEHDTGLPAQEDAQSEGTIGSPQSRHATNSGDMDGAVDETERTDDTPKSCQEDV